jgi:TonB family protein
MKRRTLVAAMTLLLLLAGFTASAQTPPGTISAAQAKAVAIYAPPPDYPLEARERHFTGSGIALLQVDQKTGYVTAAQMQKSTGHAMLDHAALAAFTRWRFKPGTVRQLRIPINYTMGKKT